MYKIEKNKPFYESLKFLMRANTIPLRFEKPYLRRFYLTHCITTAAYIICYCVFPTHHLIRTIKDDTGFDISEDITSIVSGGVVASCNTLFMLYYKKWLTFFKELEDCEKFGKHPETQRLRNKMKFLIIGYCYYILFGTTVYGMISYIDISYCKKINSERGFHELCGTFLPISLPIDGNRLSIRLPIFLLQAIVTIYLMIPGANVCLVPLEAVEVLALNIGILRVRLRGVFLVSSARERVRRLRWCIIFHQHILKLSYELNFLVKTTVGHISLVAAVVIASVANQVFKSKPLAALVFLIGITSILFCLCHAGQRILDETISVADAAYNSEWYHGDARAMRYILFVISRSQKPITLDALPLGILHYPLFLMILKTSYSYLTLLAQST